MSRLLVNTLAWWSLSFGDDLVINKMAISNLILVSKDNQLIWRIVKKKMGHIT